MAVLLWLQHQGQGSLISRQRGVWQLAPMLGPDGICKDICIPCNATGCNFMIMPLCIASRNSANITGCSIDICSSKECRYAAILPLPELGEALSQ